MKTVERILDLRSRVVTAGDRRQNWHRQGLCLTPESLGEVGRAASGAGRFPCR